MDKQQIILNYRLLADAIERNLEIDSQYGDNPTWYEADPLEGYFPGTNLKILVDKNNRTNELTYIESRALKQYRLIADAIEQGWQLEVETDGGEIDTHDFDPLQHNYDPHRHNVMVKQKYNEETLINYLLEASEALNASIKLLDNKFGTIQWRQDWTMAETAEKINNFLSSIRVDN